ncbi:UDP-N-acetylmuramoyl-tripeptide--D-alanyl-D-alanine ligase [Desulfovibrio inopinatus]|uniref:UDP-N-acetylmuramoyl-tripeptide--D-alanyl-D- alanine ligase n=1 Tax=Desulfovibrio inopinatus TaxID=102109 RepID=UPI0003F55ABA|nr:UDP-N-acetylmuramoyl-tripeptide--D-alanyl-D-alanine ligase [Desulfovibrio inopinatus]
MYVDEIARVIGAQLPESVRPDTVVESVCSDSRKACPGSLFACLPGERVDGHAFAAQAASQGAAVILAARPLADITDAIVLVVEDPLFALGQLARAWREQSAAQVIAITGSCGKTTVKEMLSTVLSQMGSTSKNHKNFNNQLGLPLSMLAASERDDFWVMELGISREGDMEALGAIAAPDVAVLHNIGPAHLEGLGNIDGVLHAKATLFEFLKPNGVAIVSLDYPGLFDRARTQTAAVITISTANPDADVLCQYVGSQNDQGVFVVTTKSETRTMTLGIAGAHYAENIAAVCAVCQHYKIGLERIEEGLRQFDNPDQRFVVENLGDYIVIDDSYNANPLSMRRSIEAARDVAGDGPLCLVLGEMRELGTARQAEHTTLGVVAAGVNPAIVLFKGESAEHVQTGLAQAHFHGRFFPTSDATDLTAVLQDNSFTHGTILVKGSRSMAMETYIQPLREISPRSTT